MKLLYVNNPILRQVCEPVKQEELDYIKGLVPDMTKIMEDEGGIGLAANQVGITKFFFIMKVGGKVQLFINPLPFAVDQLEEKFEGCLSIPGATAPVERFQRIAVKFMDENWIEQEFNLNGIEAVAVQHELDHLNGKLYIDKLKPLRKSMVMDKFRKHVKMSGR